VICGVFLLLSHFLQVFSLYYVLLFTHASLTAVSASLQFDCWDEGKKKEGERRRRGD